MLKQKSELKRGLLAIFVTVNILIMLGSLTNAGAAEYATYYPGAFNVVNGAYSSGSLPASLQNVDSDYFTVVSSPSATMASMYNPSGYNLFDGTAYVSGTTGDLSSNNDTHMVYRSSSSVTLAQSLYAHQEATIIGGNSYSLKEPESADSTGTSMSASMSTTGRHLLGRFVYPLTGISSIPATTWTEFYRTWRDPDQSIAYDSTGSGNNGDGTASITWSHVVGSGFNRFVVIGVSIRTVTVSVLNVTVGAQSATLLRNDTRGTGVRGEVWYLVNPDSGSQIVTVTLSGISKACGGSVSYNGVDQISPIDTHNANASYGSYPSVSLTTTTANEWIFSNFAITGTYTINAHGVEQTHRYYEAGTGGAVTSRAADDGDDRIAIAAGSYTLSWNMSLFTEVVAQAVAIKRAPSPVGHVDVDISILQSDGTIRTSIATNASDSADLLPTPTTLSGTYSWVAYTVVDQTDFLEIDYYVDVASGTSDMSAYLRIDDSALPLADQTRTILPYEHTIEVELTGTCNTYNWAQLQWAVDSAWTTDSVAVTVQLYNYTLGAFSTAGDGFVSYTSNATANTDEEKTQTIAANPHQFRDAAGNWKIKVEGVKTTSAPFDLKADWVELRPTYYSEYTVTTEFQFSSMTNELPTKLSFVLVNEYDVAGVSVTIQIWNYSASAYADSGQGYLTYAVSDTDRTRVLDIGENSRSCTMNGGAKIKISGVSSTLIQYQQRIDQVRLDYYYVWLWPSWLTMFLYALPLPFAALVPWILGARRDNQAEPRVQQKTGAFSEQFGMTHEQMVGQKILLEIDPASDYNMALSSFVSEARNSGESLFILTNKDSALHSVFSGASNVNFLLLSSKAQYSQPINEKETLLPSNDLSAILDACAKLQKGDGEKALNLLFDNLSDIILRSGLEKTYDFTRLLLEAIASSETTALFVFIPTSHGQETSSSIRGLFSIRLTYPSNGAEMDSS